MPIDYSKYHPKWSLIRRLIRKRSGGKCENEECGAEHKKPHPVTGKTVILTTAHVDRNRNNNRFWNLRDWCQRCHLAHDRGQRAYSQKYGKETQYQNGKLFEQ